MKNTRFLSNGRFKIEKNTHDRTTLSAMALREIISNLSERFKEELYDQEAIYKSHMTRLGIRNDYEQLKKRKRTLRLEDRKTNGETKKGTGIGSTERSIRRGTFLDPRFDLYLFKIFQVWRQEVRYSIATRTWQRYATSLSERAKNERVEEKRELLIALRQRKYSITDHAEQIKQKHHVIVARRCIAGWYDVFFVRLKRRNALTRNAFRRWKAKHERRRDVADFMTIVITRRKRSALNKWREMYRQRFVEKRYDLRSFGFFRKWHAFARLSRTANTFSRWRSALVRRNRRARTIARNTLIDAMIQRASDNESKRKKIWRYLRSRRLIEAIRGWRFVLAARVGERASRLRRSLRVWRDVVETNGRANVLAKSICEARTRAYVLRWQRALRLSTEMRALDGAAAEHVRRRRMLVGLRGLSKHAATGRKRGSLRKRDALCRAWISKRRLRRTLARWRMRCARRQYVEVAYVKTRWLRKRRRKSAVLKKWSRHFRRRQRWREFAVPTYRIARSYLLRSAFLRMSRFVETEREHQNREIRDVSRRRALRRWHRRTQAKNRAVVRSWHLEAAQRRRNMRRYLFVWVNAARSRSHRRNDAVSSFMRRRQRATRVVVFRHWVRFARTAAEDTRAKEAAALRFWFGRVMRRAFKGWGDVAHGLVSRFENCNGDALW